MHEQAICNKFIILIKKITYYFIDKEKRFFMIYIKKRYCKYIETGNIFPKPEYWIPLHSGWIEVSRSEYETFAVKRGFI